MSTKFVRAEYFNEKSGNDARFNIRLIKNLKYSEFFTDSQESLNIWKEKFQNIFIQSDFHIKFDAIKMIGKGSFARVYLVENKSNKK